MNATARLIERIGIRELAEALGTTRAYIYKVKREGYFAPARASQIEGMFGVPRETLIKPALQEFIAGDTADDLI